MSGNTAPFVLAISVTAALMLDALWGEWSRYHPLVGFGHVAQWCEKYANVGSTPWRYCQGMALTIILVGLPTITLWWLARTLPSMTVILDVLCLYWAIGWRSLGEHVRPIAQALAQQRLEIARRLTARIVSREVTQASPAELARAAVESSLENGNDAIFAALFWFVLGGAPAVVLFRLSNTLDAMWGYRTSRFFWFGKFAARWDDGLNWLPARLTALTYCLVGTYPCRAWHCWRTQAKQWDSPNAGVVMSAGAGALGVQLGGSAYYHGHCEQRPILGWGNPPQAMDIKHAWQLLCRALAVWLAILWIAGGVQAWY